MKREKSECFEEKRNGNDMTYYSKRQQWGYYITTTADNEKVTIDADAKEYNKTTRTDYADEKTLHFDANDGKLSQASASTGINIAKAGTYTIIVAEDDEMGPHHNGIGTSTNR